MPVLVLLLCLPGQTYCSGGVGVRGRLPRTEREGGIRDGNHQGRGGGVQLHAGEEGRVVLMVVVVVLSLKHI